MAERESAVPARTETTLSASHRREETGGIAKQNATGIDMKASKLDNTLVRTAHDAQGLLQKYSGVDRVGSAIGKEFHKEDQNNAHTNPQSNSSDNSQSTIASPPTSSSEGFSSQTTNQDGPLSQLSQLSQLAAQQQPLTNTTRPTLSISPTAGQKRTADGQIKENISNSPMSPRRRGHSRNTSAVSNLSSSSNRLGELSAELRTRLSYAMVKVNNGWQSNSIGEVESLASQAASPTSSSSTLHGRRNLVTSPRTAIASIQGQSGSGSNSSSQQTVDFDLYSANGQPTRTYESFWRDHSVAHNPSPRHYQVSPPSRSLAPPADIRPTPTSRRSGTPKFSKPPTIPGHNSNSSLLSNTPLTPNRDMREGPRIHTPTQKTLQEQDAIETLLFMSSPGNSGNMAHTFPPRSQASPQQSPLRTEFSHQTRPAHGKKVGFDVTATSESAASSEASGGAQYRRRGTGGSGKTTREREAAIDRLLEEMGDSSSDEEERLVLNKYSSPRRSVATAGR
ncbi:hypothetical protein HYFRA_00005356 [Hymenoscyphus fraxineus]|uniref:Uncharacterized protein n=1 Tax=Hymenoscyphus fraxineus TaxID=746836 RepID=A0A9N9PWB6_9HELO|nr:hypothetical protein HYFRA_00005356 [Hymenoscyphus fraxineus]